MVQESEAIQVILLIDIKCLFSSSIDEVFTSAEMNWWTMTDGYIVSFLKCYLLRTDSQIRPLEQSTFFISIESWSKYLCHNIKEWCQ